MVTSISASGEKLECMDVAAQSRELPCTPSVPAGTYRVCPSGCCAPLSLNFLLHPLEAPENAAKNRHEEALAGALTGRLRDRIQFEDEHLLGTASLTLLRDP